MSTISSLHSSAHLYPQTSLATPAKPATTHTPKIAPPTRFDNPQHPITAPTTQHSLNGLCSSLSPTGIARMMRDVDLPSTPKYLGQLRAMLSENQLKPLLRSKDAEANANILGELHKQLGDSTVNHCLHEATSEALQVYQQDHETKKTSMLYEIIRHGFSEGHEGLESVDHFGESAREYIIRMEQRTSEMTSLARALTELNAQLSPERILSLRQVRNPSPAA